MAPNASRRRVIAGIATTVATTLAGCQGLRSDETPQESATDIEPLQAGASVQGEPDADVIRFLWTADGTAEYLTASVDAPDAPGWEEDGKLESVGEEDRFRTGGDGTFSVTVTMHGDGASQQLVEKQVEV